MLQKLKSMGDDNRDSNLKNLTEELHITKSIFRNYSLQLYADSSKSNEGSFKGRTGQIFTGIQFQKSSNKPQ